jgi:hypothetical protein
MSCHRRAGETEAAYHTRLIEELRSAQTKAYAFGDLGEHDKSVLAAFALKNEFERLRRLVAQLRRSPP